MSTRIDLGVRIVIDVPDYRRAGLFMDDLQGAINVLLGGPEDEDRIPGRFDFTHFNTRPCKAQRMEQLALEMPVEFDGPRF